MVARVAKASASSVRFSDEDSVKALNDQILRAEVDDRRTEDQAVDLTMALNDSDAEVLGTCAPPAAWQFIDRFYFLTVN